MAGAASSIDVPGYGLKDRVARQLGAASLAGLSRLPSPLIRAVAGLAGSVGSRVPFRYQQTAARNASIVLGLPPDHPAVRENVRNQFTTQALNTLELFRTLRLTPEQVLSEWRDRNDAFEKIRQSHERGEGLILVTAHLGAFDLLGRAVHLSGVPVITVTMRTTTPWLFDLVTSARAADGLPVMELGKSSTRELLRTLREGKTIALLGDRDFTGTGMEMDYFGRPASIPVGPVKLARMTGAPIVPMFTTRNNGKYDIRTYPEIRVPRDVPEEDALREANRQLVEIYEREVGTHLGEWVTFQPVWPTERAGQPAVANA